MSSLRAQRRNLFPSTALTAGTTTSQTEKATVGRGVRLYVYVSAVTAGGGTDSISLAALPPNGSSAAVLAGFSKANMLAVQGTLVFDFYPGQSNSGFAGSGLTLTVGTSYGSAAITLPMQWAVQIVLGAGNSATIAIDTEILP
jgi:hypothetical protein